jgi:hypothetical protein
MLAVAVTNGVAEGKAGGDDGNIVSATVAGGVAGMFACGGLQA